MNWEDCKRDKEAVKISPNPERARSLEKQSKRRKEFVLKQEINKDNAVILFCELYESVLELIHSLLYCEGHKILNHICIGYYIRDVVGNKKLFDIFDRSRKIRNGNLYYGEDYSLETLKEGIDDLKILYGEIKNKIDKDLKEG